MTRPFWQYKSPPRSSDVGISWVESHLLDRAFINKETMIRYYNAGALKPGIIIEDVINKIKSLGGHCCKQIFANRHSNPEWMFVWDDSGLMLEYWPKNRGINVTVISNNSEISLPLRFYFSENIVRIAGKGRIYVVVSGSQGPRLQEMGVAGEDFIPSNYRPEVVDQYKHVVTDLNKTDPCGRIILLDGPPGTGKTHMVRAILNEVPKATFILIPSNFISSLGEPSFLNVLIREQRKDGPLILILEDADEALVNRKEGNTSAISALLNFSDGIFGTLLNMRLICTTNVEIDNLDPAVTRDGRLCSRMEIGLLDNDMANAIYERLTGKKGDLKDKFYKLGTVYKIAKGNGLTIERETTKKSMGFALGKPSQEEALSIIKDPAATPEDITRAAEAYIEDFNQDDEEIEGEPGEVITAITRQGEMVEVGYISQDGKLHITDDAFLDDDDDLIDEDPRSSKDEDDVNEMPAFLDEGLDDD